MPDLLMQGEGLVARSLLTGLRIGIERAALSAAIVLASIWMGGVATAQSVEIVTGDAAGRSQAEQDMSQGKVRFQQGAYAQAAVHWMNAARVYEQNGQTKEQCQALVNLAHALQQEGQIRRAQTTLQTALQLSERVGNRTLTATILGQLGNTTHALGKDALAAEHLTKALALAREERKPAMVASLLNDLGNVLIARRQFAEAIDVYAESRSLAAEVHHPALGLTAHINEATALIQDGQLGEAQHHLDEAWVETKTLGDGPAKLNGLLTIGLGYQELHDAVGSSLQGERAAGERPVTGRPVGTRSAPSTKELGSAGGSLLRRASDAFMAAGDVAAKLQDSRGESYAYGFLGGVLEQQRRTSEALNYTRKATLAAQRVKAPESLYRWQWQAARLLKSSGKDEEALAAYERAVSVLKPIRYEYSVGSQGRHHSFRDSVAPLFLEYEDALLRRASTAKAPSESQELLVRVRDTVEASRAAELQDYFQDDCVANAKGRRGGAGLPPQTAVVYPIALPDRLELLVETAEGLKQVQVAVGSDAVTKEARTFRRLVQDPRSKEYLASAQRLHGWLLSPLQQHFLAAGVTTIVMVPDGALRTIPVAALHDGRQFVVDKYAVALVPGMDLTDPRPVGRDKGGLLSLGVSEAVHGFPALPNAASEVQAVRTLYGGKTLMDSQVSSVSLGQEVRDERVGMLHIASHSVIDRDARNSFLLAYDGKVSMDRLAEMVGLLQYRQQPLELLTLSACETAAEDDRAALGLIGVAIKTGARSALASLWVAEDQATTELVAEFYRQLQDPGVTKAVALQRAQQKILSQPGHSHPGFWAPFLLINNWM